MVNPRLSQRTKLIWQKGLWNKSPWTMSVAHIISMVCCDFDSGWVSRRWGKVRADLDHHLPSRESLRLRTNKTQLLTMTAHHNNEVSSLVNRNDYWKSNRQHKERITFLCYLKMVFICVQQMTCLNYQYNKKRIMGTRN